MIKQHTWTCVAHYFAYAFTLRLAVTMHGTMAASVFMFTERTVAETLVGIVDELAALLARFTSAMLVATIEAYHQLNCAAFIVNDGSLVLQS